MRKRRQAPHGSLLRVWERMQLEELLHKGEAPVRVIKRAQVLSLLDRGKAPLAIADFLDLSRTTPYRIEKKYREKGFEAALVEPSRPSQCRKIDTAQAVNILAMVCEAPPPGRARWTVRLAASESVRRGILKEISREPIRKLLHEGELKPWREKNVVHSRNNPLLRGEDGGCSEGVRAPLESEGTGGLPG